MTNEPAVPCRRRVPARASAPRDVTRPKTSSRDHKQLHADLTRWLAGSAARGRRSRSSASWHARAAMACRARRCCSRRAGARTAARSRRHSWRGSPPIRQRRPSSRRTTSTGSTAPSRRSARYTSVPVPNLRWLETDPSALGAQFFVMDRVDGVVPTDLPPYAIAGWVAEGTPEQRQRLQDTSVKVLTELHAIPDADERFAFLLPHRTGESSLRQHVARHPRLLRLDRLRRHALAADRAVLPVARGQLAEARGTVRALVGRFADRQHDVPRLRARRSARLGDGVGRPAGGRPRPGWPSCTSSSRACSASTEWPGSRTCCARPTWPPTYEKLSGYEPRDLPLLPDLQRRFATPSSCSASGAASCCSGRWRCRQSSTTWSGSARSWKRCSRGLHR